MKMRQVICVLSFILLLAACTADNMKEGARYFAQSQTEIKRSHIPLVTVNGEPVHVLRGEIRPEQISGSTEPSPVPAGGVVEIDFKYQRSDPTIRIQEWHGGKHRWKKVEGNSFKLPEEKGLYLYNLHFIWDKYDGLTGSYSLFLNLQ